MLKLYLLRWKELIYGLITLYWVFHLKNEQDIVFLVVFIIAMEIIIPASREEKGIHRAVLDNDINAVGKYLDKGIDINQKNDAGIIPLMYAVSHNLPEMAKLLIELGADVNYNIENKEQVTSLHVAIIEKYHKISDLLLTNGAILDPYLAAFSGNIEFIENYIQKGENVNLQTYENRTPLHFAAWNNQLEIAKLLIRIFSLGQEFFLDIYSTMDI